MKHEKICTVCNTKYQYCPNCDSYNLEPRWKFLFCSENCNEIFNTVAQFEGGAINADEARKILDKCDLKKAQPLGAGVKEGVNKIYKQKPVVKKFVEPEKDSDKK